ncbi:MAG TPA: PBP1A family penicillin-binding protein, partial [Halanaerobiales bacterium]|nr:PBP1A family penicillin-binding protein [Halanaerobiales bacterium]
PDISNYQGASETSIVYSADGELLTKLFTENRIYVPLERIPRNLQNAVLAIEDTGFYAHHGIDFLGIVRAVVTNIVKRRERPHGASTITQQLAGNTLLNRQNVSYYRKIQEAYLAMQFERLYTKPEILEMYLNEIFLGHSAYGVEAASQQYFNKNIWELNLSESSLLAGLIRGPNYYSPLNNYELAISRQKTVLSRMLEVGYISEEEHEKALSTEIVLRSAEPQEEDFAPYFIRYVRDELIEEFGPQMVYSGGLKIYTTLDPDMQKKAEEAVKNSLESGLIPTLERENLAEKSQPQLALITLEPTTGAIRAMVGGRGNDQFNRATQAVRQPGSAFKPFVYATAIKQGYSAAEVLNDLPMVARKEADEKATIWPRNYNDEYQGYVSIRTALEQSINVAAVKMIQKTGVLETIKTAEDMGISTFQNVDKNRAQLAVALGGLTKGVTPLEMAAAYGVFANQGVWVEPTAILKVLDRNDNVLYEAHPKKRIAIPDDVAYIMSDMLQTVITRGTGWRANLNRPTGGKTGTTNNYTDAWFVGFTPELVSSVWIGEDNPRNMEYEEIGETVSSAEAAQLWGDYMRSVVKDRPVNNFTMPENITRVEIDPDTGLLPARYTPRLVNEIFRKDNVPTEIDTLHQPIVSVKVDKESGLLATSRCPEENIAEYNYFENSNIRVGPGRIVFGNISSSASDEEEGISGVYIIGEGQPVQLIDPETGEPVTDNNGEVVYEKMPTRQCDLHGPDNSNLIDSIWDFFNRF